MKGKVEAIHRSMIPLPPRCSKEFEPVQLLATGGFGAILLARQIQLDRLVVLKLLHNERRLDAFQVDKFLAEARITSLLVHPSIVRVLAVDIESGIPWIAFEHIEGESLATVLERGPLTAELAIQVGIQVARGLHAAHERQVFHRDIKPANVLVAASGEIKIIDFGIARWNSDRAVRTEAGMIYGTPEYIPPEYIRGEEFDARSDLYSLGIMLYQALSGELPFSGGTAQEVLQAHLRGSVPDLRFRRGDLPARLVQAIQKAMARDPAGRFPDALAFVDALERIEERGKPELVLRPPSPTVAHDSPRAPVASRRSFHAAWLFLIAGGILTHSKLTVSTRPPARIQAHLDARARAIQIQMDGFFGGPVELRMVGSSGAARTVVTTITNGSVRIGDIESDVRHVIEARYVGSPSVLATTTTTTPAFARVVRFSCFPATTWALVDLEYQGPPEPTLTVEPVNRSGSGFSRQLAAGSPHHREKIGGLEPGRQYRLALSHPGALGGIRDHQFRTASGGDPQWMKEIGIAVRRQDSLALASSRFLAEAITSNRDPRLLEELRPYLRWKGPTIYDQMHALHVAADFHDTGFAVALVPDPVDWIQALVPERRLEALPLLLAARHPGLKSNDLLSLLTARDRELLDDALVERLAAGIGQDAGRVACDFLGQLTETAARTGVPVLDGMVRADRARARKIFQDWTRTPVADRRLACFGLAGLSRVDDPADLSRVLAHAEGDDPLLTSAARLALGRLLSGRDTDPVTKVFERPLTRSTIWMGVFLRRRELVPLLRSLLHGVSRESEQNFEAVFTPALGVSTAGITARIHDALLAMAFLREVTPEDLAMMRRLLDASFPTVGAAAAWALGHLGDHESGREIVASYLPRDQHGAGIWAVGQLRERSAIAVLIRRGEELLARKDLESQSLLGLTCWSLGRIDRVAAEALLRRVFEAPESHAFARRHAQAALEGQTGDASTHFIFSSFPYYPLDISRWPEDPLEVHLEGLVCHQPGPWSVAGTGSSRSASLKGLVMSLECGPLALTLDEISEAPCRTNGSPRDGKLPLIVSTLPEGDRWRLDDLDVAGYRGVFEVTIGPVGR